MVEKLLPARVTFEDPVLADRIRRAYRRRQGRPTKKTPPLATIAREFLLEHVTRIEAGMDPAAIHGN